MFKKKYKTCPLGNPNCKCPLPPNKLQILINKLIKSFKALIKEAKPTSIYKVYRYDLFKYETKYRILWIFHYYKYSIFVLEGYLNISYRLFKIKQN